MTEEGSLARQAIPELLRRFAARTPTPGGGAAAGLAGALGGALGAMALRFALPPEGAGGALFDAAEGLEREAGFLAAGADEDCRAYEAVRTARRLPKTTPEEKRVRAGAVDEATRGAMEAPLAMLGRLDSVSAGLAAHAGSVKPALASDLASAAWCLRAAAEMAWLNVRINAAGLPGDPRARAALDEGQGFLERIRSRLEGLLRGVEASLGGAS